MMRNFVAGHFWTYKAVFAASILAAGAFATAVAWGEVAIANDQLAVVDQSAELSDVETRALQPLNAEYGSEVEKRWRAVLAEQGLREGENDRSVFIASGVATVVMDKAAPGWIESRRVAHDVAFARAKADLVAFMGQTIQQSGSARFTSNTSFGQGQIQEHETIERTARILEKAGDLVEATLDTALREMDPTYDASRYARMSIPERTVVLEDLFTQSTYRAAARVIAGASTYRVIEGPSADGMGHEVLVAMVWSPRLSALAAAIQEGSTSMPVEGARVRPEDMLPQTVGEAVAQMGTRVFIDDRGDRAIISFAQTEPARVNPRDRDMARRAALSRAENLALGQIAAFVGENITLESSEDARQLTQVYADLVQRGVQIDIQQVETIRSATGRVNITGGNTIWRQVVEHPETQQDMAIVAVVWSPSSQAMGGRMGTAIDAARAAGRGAADPMGDPDPSDGERQQERTPVFESKSINPDAL
jgi:hypothetical protein